MLLTGFWACLNFFPLVLREATKQRIAENACSLFWFSLDHSVVFLSTLHMPVYTEPLFPLIRPVENYRTNFSFSTCNFLIWFSSNNICINHVIKGKFVRPLPWHYILFTWESIRSFFFLLGLSYSSVFFMNLQGLWFHKSLYYCALYQLLAIVWS